MSLLEKPSPTPRPELPHGTCPPTPAFHSPGTLVCTCTHVLVLALVFLCTANQNHAGHLAGLQQTLKLY